MIGRSRLGRLMQVWPLQRAASLMKGVDPNGCSQDSLETVQSNSISRGRRGFQIIRAHDDERPDSQGGVQSHGPATAKIAGAELLAESMPHNAAKAAEHGKAAMKPPQGQTVEPPHPMVTGSTLTETNASEKVGKGNPQVSFNPDNGPLDRVRVDSGGRALTTNRRPGRGQPELAQGRPARPDAARRFHPAREDHALRSRAHSRAHRARARLGRARLFRVLRAADRSHARVDLRRSGQAHAGVRALFDRRRRARLDRHRARRARLRGQVLHRRRQLGPRRQQHSGVLHPGRDEVSGPHPCGEARAASRDAAGGVGARHVLGFRLADARIDAHADVGHVGPRDSAQLPHDAGLRRAHVPVRQRARANRAS